MDETPALIHYDEFGLFHENASEYGLPFGGPPSVRRVDVEVAPGRAVSALLWGDDPEVVLVHGGAQNAHTWDTVIMAMGIAALAVDLPGHGHSGWRDDGAYTPMNLADDVAVAIAELAPNARAVVGMSLGGLTSLQLAVRHPHLVRKLALIDITPGVNQQKAKAVTDFVNGPQDFPDFASLLARTQEHNPTRSESSLRRGILHNAKQEADGSWRWRYDRRREARTREESEMNDALPVVINPMWEDLGTIVSPVMLVRGGISPVVDDEDVAESRRRLPDIRVEVVDGAGHSIQGDRPNELAALLTDFF